jgi:hypothetical protein
MSPDPRDVDDTRGTVAVHLVRKMRGAPLNELDLRREHHAGIIPRR